MVQLKLFNNKRTFKGYTLIEGFPGYGLVGTIAANFIAEKLDMELIGYVESPLFPPVTAIHNGKPLPPMRIYESKKHKLLLAMAEFVMSVKVIHLVSDVIYTWCLKNGIKKIVSLGGISIKGKQDEVFCISSDSDELKVLEKLGVIPIKEGATTGVNAMLLIKSSMQKKVPVILLLAEAKRDYADPFGAALVLTSLSKYLGIKIDTTELVKEAMIIESKLRQSIEAAKNVESEYKGTYSGMYA